MPLAFAAGVKTSRPAVMSAVVTTWPAVTGTPLRVRLPADGRVVITTAWKLLAGLSLGSLNPKFVVDNV